MNQISFCIIQAQLLYSLPAESRTVQLEVLRLNIDCFINSECCLTITSHDIFSTSYARAVKSSTERIVIQYLIISRSVGWGFLVSDSNANVVDIPGIILPLYNSDRRNLVKMKDGKSRQSMTDKYVTPGIFSSNQQPSMRMCSEVLWMKQGTRNDKKSPNHHLAPYWGKHGNLCKILPLL